MLLTFHFKLLFVCFSFFFHAKFEIFYVYFRIATLCTTLDLRISSGDDSEADESTTRQVLAIQQQPVLLIAQQLLPFLKGVVDHWGSDEQISEV
jgi:hypothetical protein